MRQLLLDLLPDQPPRLDALIVASNRETLALFSDWLEQGKTLAFFLCGEAASGKTHVLRASGLPYVDAGSDPGLCTLPEVSQIALDNVSALNEAGVAQLFTRYNQARVSGGQLLFADRLPPSHLTLREDLRTRLGSGPVCRLLPLSDQDKAQALADRAAARRMSLRPELIDYLLNHAPRDLSTLLALVDALDRLSLEQQRPLTLPLLREVLQALNNRPQG